MQRSAADPRAGPVKKAKTRPAKSSSDGWTISDVAFKDAILAPAPRRITRTKLDLQVAQRYATRNTPEYLAKVSNGSDGRSLTGLQRACMRVLTANITNIAILKQLEHIVLPLNMLDPLLKRLAACGEELPFATWRALVQADALPGSTYRGLVLDDVAELHSLRADTMALPVASLLDLSETTFQRDFHNIRVSLGSSLCALRLDGLKHIDDDCMADLARTAEQSQLEIMSLKGCNRITDRSSTKLSQFSTLRMLGAYAVSAYWYPC